MDFTSFCQPFYQKGKRKNGALIGYTTQEKIAQFFLENAVKRSGVPSLNYDSTAFSKWFTGSRPVPTTIWKMIVGKIDLAGYTSDISIALNTGLLQDVARKFNITLKPSETLSKKALASAIAQQLVSIAQGNGEAANIMNDAYHSSINYTDFTVYIKKTWDKYSKLKTLLYTSNEHDFYDFFVCNRIRTIPLTIRNIHNSTLLDDIENGELAGSIDWELTFQDEISRRKRGVIEAVTMEKIDAVSHYSLLVGMGGIGKSMMMRHLFLSANKAYPQCGILPILVILREFNPESTNLITMITDSVSRFDSSFNEDKLKQMLSNGECRLLLDGLDEIKSSDTNIFLNQLDALIDQYPDNQIVMSTRRFSSFIELQRFAIIEMLPFTRKQSLELIDKLEYCPDEPNVKKQFREKLVDDYFTSHKEFVNNPLLLTLMLMCYRRFAGIAEKRHLFYEQAYDTLLMRHDYDKLYKRVFHSVNDPSEFTIVFREFCAKSYRKRDYEFDRKKFESYFSALKSLEWLDRSKMTLDNFIYDVCHSACLMYEEGQTYHFLHRSFQEYFFADYYAHKDGNTLMKLSKYILEHNFDPFDDNSAFRMMYALDPGNVERFILYPYLRDIFSAGTEKEQFWKYICSGYDEWRFAILNKEQLEEYNIDSESVLPIHRFGGRAVKSVIQLSIMGLLSKRYSSPTDISSLSFDDDTFSPSLMVLIGDRDSDNHISLFPIPKSREDSFAIARRHMQTSYIIDDDGKPVVFGYICTLGLEHMLRNKEKYAQVISIWEAEDCPTKAEFREVKQLYERFKKKYEHVDDMDDDDF